VESVVPVKIEDITGDGYVTYDVPKGVTRFHICEENSELAQRVKSSSRWQEGHNEDSTV
jgi:hypothetical protein